MRLAGFPHATEIALRLQNYPGIVNSHNGTRRGFGAFLPNSCAILPLTRLWVVPSF